jgi:hypothetical protein
MAISEGRYREGMSGGGTTYSATRAYQIGARGQIDAGRRELDRIENAPGDPPHALPEALSDREQTAGGIPGAQFLTARARQLHPDGTTGADADQTQLLLEANAHGQVARFHNIHLQRDGFYTPIDPTSRASTGPSQATLTHRDQYVDARAAQIRSQTALLRTYGPAAQLTGDRALEAAGVSLERLQAIDELGGVLARSRAIDRQVTEAETRDHDPQHRPPVGRSRRSRRDPIARTT